MSSSVVTLLIVCGFLCLSVAYLAFRLSRISRLKREAEIRLDQMERLKDSTQLPRIESRLNPHLFKNILNSIQSHAYQTYFALDKLANVLDYILYESQQQHVKPKEEIDFTLDLIEINKIKLSPLFELEVITSIDKNDPLYYQPVIAPLISVDLIENAFKHADFQNDDAFISINLSFKDGVYHLKVSNKNSNKSALAKEKGGIGTSTLEQRLNLLYGRHFKLERIVEDNVYIAILKIDLGGFGAEMHTVG
ncbi:MAG: histidine kinase [Flavitalea sp.]